MENKYYIYLHIKLDSGEPFYIGKGNGYRAYVKQHRSDYWNKIVTKHGLDVILLEENLTEEQAFEKEKYWINIIGRKDLGKGPLINFTDGGEGNSGRKHSEESKKKMSEMRKKRKYKPLSEETKKKLSESIKGIKRSEETKKKISEIKKGNNYNIGRKHSEESKKKMSDNKKGYKHSEETKRKISETKKRK